MKSKLSISNVLAQSWKALTSQFWVLVGLFIAYIIIASLAGTMSGGSNPSGAVLGSVVISFFSLLIGMLFMLGYVKNCLDALDGEEPQFSAYGQFRKVLPTLGAYLLIAIPAVVIFVGGLFLANFGALTGGQPFRMGPVSWLVMAVFLIAMIYFGIRLGFYVMFIVEEDAGAIESLRKSWKLTEGHVGELLLLIVVSIGIAIAGILCLGVGLLVAAPLTYVMMCAAYRQMKAPAADDVEEIEKDI
ncbi:hypothetical protein FACS1894181_18250 [Bacteroidia bacterium]|nr:hypothetical protein FACS1894181_18250 [Bacteroidia bacterium]